MKGLRNVTALFIAGAVAGATAAVLMDPRLGARRRALARDKCAHYVRIAPRTARRMARRLVGPLHGFGHRIETHLPWYTAAPLPDDDMFIKQRVETALGRSPNLPLDHVVFDAVDGFVRVRGEVPDETCAEQILAHVAAVPGVRAAFSLMHTPDGRPVGGVAGDAGAVPEGPRAAIYGQAVRRSLMERWPSLTDEDILASDGHVERLTERICDRTGQAHADVRPALDAILLAAT
jgi:hypothetical protein